MRIQKEIIASLEKEKIKIINMQQENLIAKNDN
jgi:hypothetical protein